MAALNLSGKTSGFIKLTAPEVATNSTVELPNKNGILATLDDVGEGGGGGGGGVAQPPVAMSYKLNNDFVISSEATGDYQVVFDKKDFDTINGLDSTTGTFTPTKSGIYQINYSVHSVPTGQRMVAKIFKNDKEIGIGTQTFDGTDKAQNISLCSILVEMNGTTDYLDFQVLRTGGTGDVVVLNESGTYLNIHMISSITEGEVKEKEAVVVMAKPNADQVISKQVWTQVNLDDVESDTTSSLIGGVFKPSVSGYYQVSAMINSSGSAIPVQSTLGRILKNGKDVLFSTNSNMRGDEDDHLASNMTGIVYLDGVNDSITLEGYVNSSSPKLKKEFTYLNVHLITGQSTGGGSGGGETTDILPVLMTGTVGGTGNVVRGLGFTSTQEDTGVYRVTFDEPFDSKDIYNVVLTISGSERTIGYDENTGNSFRVIIKDTNNTLANASFSFVLSAINPIAVGGGSGGGSYTPEKMVWEDVTADRAVDKEEINDNDVPIYVQLYFTNIIGTAAFDIDGIAMGATGSADNTLGTYHSASYIVPAGSTYKLRTGSVGGAKPGLVKWHEARMPMAVGAGGKTVAFRANLSSDQPVATTGMTKVNLDEASIDTDSSFVDGKFQPSVSGYYQVNGAITQNSNPQSKNLQSAIYKNGVEVSRGSQTILSEDTEGSTQDSVVSDIVYLNGTTDYIELYGSCDSTGTRSIFSGKTRTYLSAVLVSGGSASGGDSIWKQNGTNVSLKDDSVQFIDKGTFTKQVIFSPDGSQNLKTEVLDNGKNLIASSNAINFEANGNQGMRISSDGLVYVPKSYDTTANASPNVVFNAEGKLMRSTVTSYSAEEVDKKLAIKDTLIEKLSARLDELEKRVK